MSYILLRCVLTCLPKRNNPVPGGIEISPVKSYLHLILFPLRSREEKGFHPQPITSSVNQVFNLVLRLIDRPLQQLQYKHTVCGGEVERGLYNAVASSASTSLKIWLYYSPVEFGKNKCMKCSITQNSCSTSLPIFGLAES